MAITDNPHIEQDGNKPRKLSDKHLALARRGAELTRLIKDQQTELKKINDQLKKEIGPGVSIVLPEECRIPIAESVSKAIGDQAGLKGYLGTRKFNLMTTQKVTVSPSATLLELAENSEEVAAFMTDKKSVSVKYLPIKTQK